MKSSDEISLQSRLKNAERSSAGQTPRESPNSSKSSTGSPRPEVNTIDGDTKSTKDAVYGWVAPNMIRALVRMSRLKIDTNERFWKPLGYVTIALILCNLVLIMWLFVLSNEIMTKKAELARLRSATAIKSLRGGYVVWENETGKYLAIPVNTLDGPPRSCQAGNVSYLCLRVKKL